MTTPFRAAALVMLLLGGRTAGQDPKAEQAADAALLARLDRALPRTFPKPTERFQLTPSHAIDWDAAVARLGEILVDAAGRPTEPRVLYVLGCTLFQAGSFDEAKATFEDIKARFPDHPLSVAVLTADGQSLVDAGLSDCATEIKFRAANAVPELPRPKLDTERTITLHLTPGPVKIQLYANAAPAHVENFIKLARAGFYDGTKVHKAMPSLFIQMGDPKTRNAPANEWGQGDPGYTLPQEPNLVTHRKGTVTMIRAGGVQRSHGSQFQVLLADQSQLDFQQTAFGEVVEGFDVLERLAKGVRNQFDAPAEDCVIRGISF